MDADNQLEKHKLERREQQCQELLDLLERCVNFKHWGFQRTYTSVTTQYPPTVIYDSELCRVKIHHGGRDMYGRWGELTIYYGRLHAPNDKWVMNWKDEDCNCWHRIYEPLNFLDGLSPQEAVDQQRVRYEWPRVMEQFKQSDFGQKLRSNQPEWLLKMHVASWEFYGQKLFNLFDLRNVVLWQQYTNFIKDFYSIRGLNPDITPLQDKIC